MKHGKRIISLCCAIIAILSVLTVSAFANNHTDEGFAFWIYPPSLSLLGSRAKTDTTPVYLYITSSTSDKVWVSTVGCTESLDNFVNLTCVNGAIKNHVTCYVGTKYSVHSFIYEYGYSYASLEFESADDSIVYLAGVWSPDSVGTYTYAT